MAKEPTLARAVREARRRQRISQRELARRSGVAASQISRIEAGEIKNTSWLTTEAIAHALGRQSAFLAFLAENALIEEVAWAFERRSEIDFEVAYDKLTDEQLERMRVVACDAFIEESLADHLGGSEDDRLERVVSYWPGLTHERRDVVARFVEDQLTLSELDRRRKPAKEEVA